MDDRLINIYIPFKDNKDGRKQSHFLGVLNVDIQNIDKKIDSLISDAKVLVGDIDIGIVCRSDNGTPAYYWRYKSKIKGRKFYRLSNDDLFDYLCTLPSRHIDTLGGIEEDLIYCNANLRIIYKFKNEIKKTNLEIEDLNRLESKHHSHILDITLADFRNTEIIEE